MASLRIWILAVALGSFAAGMVIGVALPGMIAARPAADTPEQQYVREMAERYGLTAAQQRSLRLILQHDREQELEILSSADWGQLPKVLLNRRLEGQRMTERYIEALLDERQLALYQKDSRPLGAGLDAGASRAREGEHR